MEDSLLTRVTTGSAVTAIIGTRMYPVTAPSVAVVPYIVYRRTSTVRQQAFGSASGNVRAVFELIMVQRTPKLARALARAVRLRLHRWRDASGSPVVEDVFLESEDEYLVELQDKRFEVIQNYLVFYLE